MLKRFESFVPRKIDDRQKKGQVLFEERFKKLIDLAKHIKEKFNKKFKIADEKERFLVNVLKNSEIKINYSDNHTLYFFNREGEYLAEIDFEEGTRVELWLSGDNVISKLQNKHGLHYFKELDKFIKETMKKYFDIVPTKIDHTVSGRDEYLELDYQEGLYKDPYILGVVDEAFVPRTEERDMRRKEMNERIKKEKLEFAKQLQETLSNIGLKTIKDEKEAHFLSMFVDAKVRINLDIYDTIFIFRGRKSIAEVDYDAKSVSLDFPEIWKKFEDRWNVKYDESIRLISKYLSSVGLKDYYPIGAPEGSLFLASRELTSLSNI